MKTDLVKGFKDYTGEEALKRAEIRKILVETFEKYGFEPAETPIIENEEFVKGENKEDEAVSDIFKLRDKGKRKLALRYEFTFQLKRIANNKKLPYKRYQIGPVFRDEPTSLNRFRQFTQCDADVIGSSVKDEAEILALAKEVFDKLGVQSEIFVGNRNIFKGIAEILFGLKDKESINELIRYFDKLDKQKPSEIIKEIEQNKNKKSFLKKMQIAQFKSIFLPLLNTLRNNDLNELRDYYLGILKNRNQEKDYNFSLFKQGYDEVIKLISFCKNYRVNLQFNGALVRGLSYYTGNVFEIKTNTLKETIVAGGSYLVNGIQATGISFGVERISMLTQFKKNKKSVLVVSLNEDKQAIKIANELRKRDNLVSIFFGKPSKALEYANSYNIQQVIFVGAQEVKKKKFKVKDMKTGREKVLVLEKRSKKNVIMQRKK